MALHSAVLHVPVELTSIYVFLACCSTKKDGASSATKELDSLMASLSCLTTLVCCYL